MDRSEEAYASNFPSPLINAGYHRVSLRVPAKGARPRAAHLICIAVTGRPPISLRATMSHTPSPLRRRTSCCFPSSASRTSDRLTAYARSCAGGGRLAPGFLVRGFACGRALRIQCRVCGRGDEDSGDVVAARAKLSPLRYTVNPRKKKRGCQQSSAGKQRTELHERRLDSHRVPARGSSAQTSPLDPFPSRHPRNTHPPRWASSPQTDTQHDPISIQRHVPS